MGTAAKESQKLKGFKYKVRTAAQIRVIKKITIPVFTEREREARGRKLVRSTCGSILRSQRSLITQPAALVTKLPRIMIPTIGKGGVPSAAKNTAHKAGIIKISRPSGLCHRSSLRILTQVGSCF